MPEIYASEQPILPMHSGELLWEWDVPSDLLHLSRGALSALQLKVAPDSMAAFYRFVPEEAAVELAAMREGLISGRTGPFVEYGYICNGFWTRERALALVRGDDGRAIRLMGALEVAPLRDHVGFRGGYEVLVQAGVFLYNPTTRQLWRDDVCAGILGDDAFHRPPFESGHCFLPVHQAELGSVLRHYELLCEGESLGDTITDTVRVRVANGEYVPMLLRSTAMQRDAAGKALWVAGVLTPVDGHVVAELAQPGKDDRLISAVNSMSSGQWNWDTRQDSLYFSPRYLAILGYPAEDEKWFSEHWRNYVHPDDLDKVTMAQLRIIISGEHGDAYECTYRMRRADGGWAWIFDRGCVTWRENDGRAGHMMGTITNITTAQAERDQLEELVRHDTLTGLRSRAFCSLEIEHIEQNDIRPVSIISVDITGLKMVNDYLGHARGDELLTSAASIMRNALRRSDCIGRIGGDEFMVLLPGCDREKGKKVLEKLRNAFAVYNSANPSLPVYAALGLASSDSVDESIEEIMHIADEQMYHDKKLHRKEAHGALKDFIRQSTGREVGVDDRISDE